MGKQQDGFTKAAQKKKFIRNRDLKLKNNELQKEQTIQTQMCIGICDRCKQKLQWKFQFAKYKPLKSPGNCKNCHLKVITKAYRTLCDACASLKHCCASCCTTEFHNTYNNSNDKTDGNGDVTMEQDGDNGGTKI